jgi:hypothetical protein
MRVLYIMLFLLIFSDGYAQYVRDGHNGHPLRFSFEAIDSLDKTQSIYKQYIDTAGIQLWQIGKTTKPIFSLDTGNTVSIMTDTVNPYPVRADDYFVLRYHAYPNGIFSFMHKYNTTAGKDGGIVEYSIDTGKTWKNAMGGCNGDDLPFAWSNILTENFYKKTDTLYNGLQGFSGNSNGWKKTRMQVYHYPSVKNTAVDTCVANDVMVRFRFVSDSIADTNDGWLIDNIILERDEYSKIPVVSFNPALVYPNPVLDGIVNFPALINSGNYRIIITGTTGEILHDTPYTNTINISNYQLGLYYYKVSNGETMYTGKLLKQ